ncbi:MAG: DUF362 domain-containing protein [Candidatus Marinimicrobia bacterium]|nr:DUF362 domain-containing protein [Candidatus Neomarinimicrobiota bacterium]
MDRRNFIRTLCSSLSLTAMGWSMDKDKESEESTKSTYNSKLVAVRNGEPVEMFKKGIKEFGGMENYVSKGQTVVVKPNIAWARDVETGADTNPALVGEIVRQCLDAGASKVYVFDHTCNNWKECYNMSGIRATATEAGAEVVSGDSEKYFKQVKIPEAKVLKETKVHQLLLESDVLINVPVIKHHGSTNLTCGMKNLMGVVWDRGFYHRNGLHQCITDFCHFRKPDLNIADGYRVTVAHGPQRARPEDIKLKKMQLISEDIVALDTAATQIIGYKPEDVAHIKYAYNNNFGEMDLSKVNVKKIVV